jgi:hypothetical protein
MADAKRFLSDVVRDHQMKIELDQGVHRSILFKRPHSGIYHFRLVTWPGHLAISGDVGDYIFARLPDMFDFFRYAGPEYDKDDRINRDYWNDKLRSNCVSSERYQMDDKAYLEAVRSMLNDHIRGMSLSDAKTVVEEAKRDDLFEVPGSHPQACVILYRWRCPVTGRCPFDDFWDYRVTTESFQLVWSMRAIQWGIKRYDLFKQGRDMASHNAKILAGEV